MSGAARSAHLDHHRRSGRHSWVRSSFRNLLLRLGFEERVRSHWTTGARQLGSPSQVRKTAITMPKDYIRRQRMSRNISNFVIVALLSVGAAYVITRPTGGNGFSLSAELQRPLAGPVTASNAVVDTSGYSRVEGPLPVSEVSDLVLHDGNRNKDLHVRVFYPEKAGRYPVIVFSHGAGGSQACCDSLTRHWASYGYITVQPTHQDSALARRNGGEESIRFTEAVRDALKKPAMWESRPEDISFVLDSLPALEQRIPALGGEIDAVHIGVAGHSMGAYTAEAIAGALIDLPSRKSANFIDSRVRAVLCLSPQGPGQFGLTEHSFDRISLPYLGVTGSLDSLGPASPAWHKVPFDRSLGGDKYHLFIQGASHMSFIGPSAATTASEGEAEAILGYTNSASLAFWDAYLKGDSAAKSYLASDHLAAQSHHAVTLDRR